MAAIVSRVIVYWKQGGFDRLATFAFDDIAATAAHCAAGTAIKPILMKEAA